MPRSPNPFPDKMDALSKHGAGLIAACIMDFWARRGLGNVKAERFEVWEGTWGVRSNLVGGLPPARTRHI
jgi:hypothetical protein